MEKSNDRVWVYSDITKKYYILGAGITNLKEVYKATLLETPNVFSPFCGREILYHTGQLEFEGFRVEDDALGILLSKHLKQGKDGKVIVIYVNRNDVLQGTFMKAKKIEGYVSMENPGSGEGPLGSKIKGKLVYSKEPREGIFDESTQVFA